MVRMIPKKRVSSGMALLTHCIGQDLPRVLVIALLQLTDALGLCQGLQVVVLGEPGREITGFVSPGLPQRHPFELAEGRDAAQESEIAGSERDSTSI